MNEQRRNCLVLFRQFANGAIAPGNMVDHSCPSCRITSDVDCKFLRDEEGCGYASVSALTSSSVSEACLSRRRAGL